ncbi:MAG: nucleotide exchange factor GrpE [Polyangiaceae bacterium]
MSSENEKQDQNQSDEPQSTERPLDGESSAEPSTPLETIDPLEAARSEAGRLKEMWMRTAADFDNFRKRSRKEVEDARRGGREELLKELLPVFDNLERAIQSAQRATDIKGVSDGLSMILKQFEATLGRVSITKVPTTGTSFDPAIHEAIQQVETDEHPPGTVVAEVQPGYIQGDKLVRAAMVVVAKPKATESN